ncbi:MAG: CARDB domain-containing protein [Chitinophagaceae bacterium]
MKQLLFMAIGLIAISQLSFCQTDSLRQRTLNNLGKKNPQLDVNTPAKKNTVVLQQSNINNASAGLAPDLTITALNVRYTGSVMVNGQSKNVIQISCTVKNIGTTAISARDAGLDGKVSTDPSNTGGIAGCGTVLSSIASDMINAGASFTKVYTCTLAYDKSAKAYYNITVSTSPNITELNKQNNTAQITILGQ